MFFPFNVLCSNHYIPQTCDDMPDEATYTICLIAKKFQTPLDETFVAFFLADIEATAFFCHFRTNSKFKNAKNKIRIWNVYDYLIQNSVGNFSNSYCRDHYLNFGPSSKNSSYE